MAAELPESPKEIATQLSLAIAAALSDGERRLEVTLPDGLCFGLFGAPPGRQELGAPDTPVPKVTRQQGDIELAFLTAEVSHSRA